MRINIRGRMQIYATGIIGLFVLTAGCGGSYSQPVAAPTAPANTSTTLPSTATARAEESSSAESPPARTTRTFTLAASDVTFPAMVPSQLPVAPSGFMRRWGVYETAMVWAVDRPELEFRLITGWDLDPVK